MQILALWERMAFLAYRRGIDQMTKKSQHIQAWIMYRLVLVLLLTCDSYCVWPAVALITVLMSARALHNDGNMTKTRHVSICQIAVNLDVNCILTSLVFAK